ncbi:MAG: DUF3999 domain-containing protein [Gammaproteobacteria bacterium]|nr:DUF3999 domain-containing protein [Gammaproteobacteria bacterium]MCZ6854276.1 DUF3999 domain-containing protein [Gammaproteobacteria bacterium]
MIQFVVLIALSTSLCAFAAPVDFARGRVVEPMETTAIQRLTIPQDVYEWVVRADLGDLRVYNGELLEVPYAIRRPASIEDHTPWVVLPVFPLPSPRNKSEDTAQVNIELADSGAVIAVHGASVNNLQGGDFLIDASAIDIGITELDIDWSQEGGFMGKFQIEASDDLDDWHATVTSATLATLETGGRKIIVDKITLPGVHTRYLKISQLDGATPITIDRVSARALRRQLPQRHWKTLAGAAREQGYEYDTGGQFPLDRIILELEQPTFLITAKLFSKAASGDRWRNRGERTFYRVEVDGAFVSSDPVAYPTRDQYWRAEIPHDEQPPPTLKVGWLPDELVFIKQGDAPYLMVYGQADITGRPWPMSELLNRLGNDVEIQNIPFARLSAANRLGGPARLLSAPDPLDWETILLWAVLVVGVAGIVLLAFRLARQ